MKTAICYYSRHHGNTLKVLQAMAEEGDIDLIDVTDCETVQLAEYDCVGFASGVYFGKFHEGVIEFAWHTCRRVNRCFSFAPMARPRETALGR